jgi:hypothetical protein
VAVKWCMAGETCGDSDGKDMGEVISVPESSHSSGNEGDGRRFFEV